MENRTQQYDAALFSLYMLPTVVTVPALGLPANAMVIRLLLGKPGICSTSEIFTLHLAMLDLLFCVMFLAEYVYLKCAPSQWAAAFLAWGLNQGGGPLLLCLLSLDSYVAVCHPLVFLRLKNPKLRLSMCWVVNAMTLTCCGLVKSRGEQKWKVILFLISFVLVVISACTILILKSLRQLGPSGKELHPVKKRAFKIVLTVYVLMNVHYLPPVVEYALRDFYPAYLKPFSALTSVSYFALSMSSFLQPLCYLVRTKQLTHMWPHLCSDRGTKPPPRSSAHPKNSDTKTQT